MYSLFHGLPASVTPHACQLFVIFAHIPLIQFHTLNPGHFRRPRSFERQRSAPVSSLSAVLKVRPSPQAFGSYVQANRILSKSSLFHHMPFCLRSILSLRMSGSRESVLHFCEIPGDEVNGYIMPIPVRPLRVFEVASNGSCLKWEL